MKKVFNFLISLMIISLFFGCRNDETMPSFNEKGKGVIKIDSYLSISKLRSIDISAQNSPSNPDAKVLSMSFESDTWNNDTNKPILLISVGDIVDEVPSSDYDYKRDGNTSSIHISHNVKYNSESDDVRFFICDKTQYNKSEKSITFNDQNKKELAPLNDNASKTAFNFIFTAKTTVSQLIQNKGRKTNFDFKPLGTVILFDASTISGQSNELSVTYNCLDLDAMVDLKTGLSRDASEQSKTSKFTLKRGASDKSIYGLYCICRKTSNGEITLSGFDGPSSSKKFTIGDFSVSDGKFITLKANKAVINPNDTDWFLTEWSGTNSIHIEKVEGENAVIEYRESNGVWKKAELSQGSLDIPNLDASKTYELRMFGMSSIKVNNYEPNKKNTSLSKITQWGTTKWSNFSRSFFGCENLGQLQAQDKPDLSVCQNVDGMFSDCSKFQGNETMKTWDVSKVTNMDALFSNCKTFDISLSSWDVSSVTSMNETFSGALKFNNGAEPLLWGDKTKNLTSISKIFYNAQTFNQSVENWNVTNVKDMSYAFNKASAFNKNVKNWNVENVTNMKYMFAEASKFNNGGEVLSWGEKTKKVKDMSYMFSKAVTFNQPLNDWDVSSVTNMASMFEQAYLFDQPLNDWDVSSVTNMEGMFHNAHVFNQNINDWNVSNVTQMGYMFADAYKYNQPLDKWGDKLNKLTRFSFMFSMNEQEGYNKGKRMAFNQNINNWKFPNVRQMVGVFSFATSFNQPLNNWVIPQNVRELNSMFLGAKAFNQDISSWDVSRILKMNDMFSKTDSFNQPLNGWTVSSATSMNHMFAGAKVFNLPLNNWDVSNVTSMRAMFKSSIFQNDISNWNVEKVTEFGDIFDGGRMLPEYKGVCQNRHALFFCEVMVVLYRRAF